MFGRKSKTELAVQSKMVELLTAQVEALSKEKTDLLDRMNKLQDALVAKESPQAYQDRQYVPTVKPPENVINDLKIMSKYMEELRSDKPMFETADDLISLVSSVRGVPQSRSIHGNDES